MRAFLFLLVITLLAPILSRAQYLSWSWGEPTYFQNGSSRGSNGKITSAACLDSVIALSAFVDSTQPNGSAPTPHEYVILNYRGQVVRQWSVPTSSNDGDVMQRLTDTSFVVFCSYTDTSRGGPRYALNAKAYGIHGQELWRRTFGFSGNRSYLGYSHAVAGPGGGVDVIVNEPDLILPIQRYNNYYRLNPQGQVVQGPMDITNWPRSTSNLPYNLRPNRLGFLAYERAFVAGERKMLVYRADIQLGNTRIDTIEYGADSTHEQTRVYPTGDDGFLYVATGPSYFIGRKDWMRYTYMARYDAQGQKLWSGRQKRVDVVIEPLADGGLLVFANRYSGYTFGGTVTSYEKHFSRLRADSSVVWDRLLFSSEDTVTLGSIAYDGRDGGIFYGNAQLVLTGLVVFPWVGYITNLGRPLDPTPVAKPVFTGPPGGLQVYPNPARSGSRLRYRLPAGSRGGTFTLLAPDGRFVDEFPLTSPEGELTLPPGLASGLYLLRGPAHTCRVAVE